MGGDDSSGGIGLADGASAAQEEDWAKGLGEEPDWNHGRPGVNQTDPERPPPANGGGAVAGYHRSEERAHQRRLGVISRWGFLGAMSGFSRQKRGPSFALGSWDHCEYRQ